MRPPAKYVDQGPVHGAAVQGCLSLGVGHHGASKLPGAHAHPALDAKRSHHVNYVLPGKIYVGIHQYSMRLAHDIPAPIATYTRSSDALTKPNLMYAPKALMGLCTTMCILLHVKPENTVEEWQKRKHTDHDASTGPDVALRCKQL